MRNFYFILGLTFAFGCLSNSYGQNVGIGQPAPQQKLDINGAVRIGTTAANVAGSIRYNAGVFEGYNGSAWIPFGGAFGPAGGDLTGTYPDPAIATGAVTSTKILDGTIVNADIANGTINLTQKVTGVLPIANGGTNTNAIGPAGTIAYSNGLSYAFTAPGTAGQALVSNGAGAPTWATVAAGSGTTNYLARWTPNGNTLGIGVTYDNGTNVGIGNTAPAQKLDVTGNARVNNVFVGDVGHGATWAGWSHYSQASTTGYALLESNDGAYTFLNKLNTGSGYIGFRVSNVDRAVITNAGDMGVGTTNPQARIEANLGGASGNGIAAVSGAAGAHVNIGMGRTTGEFTIGLAAAAGNYSPNARAGDITLRTVSDASRMIFNNSPTNTTNGQAAMIIGNNAVIAQALGTYHLDFQQGPGTGADNAWHTVQLASGFAMNTLSIYASDRLDGEIKINGVWMGDLLTGGAITWRGINAAATAQNSTANVTGTGVDNNTHTCNCADGEIAVGFEAYATGRLDGYMKLKCQALRAGFTTTSSGMGVQSAMGSPWNNGADNTNHWCGCPPGTYVKGVTIYASNYLDGNVQLWCTGIRPN